ncbi:hypothetical protein [Sulfitobacter geojensis]|uniref:hypothetical protein n=1 Tax=Sulfitobacter geojensis TaxID=1342299 RepID=UPI001EEF5CF7|nr:hypothetical protein [Sulfitobacter geojensis]
MLQQDILDEYRASARTEREKGDYFERLVRVFLVNDDPKYPLELFQRLITVSIETMKIVNILPPLDMD